MAAPDRSKTLDSAIFQIQKQFGKGSIMQLGQNPRKIELEIIPSGALALDAALGIGGYPKGRIIEIYGPESSGKTTLCQHVIAEAQKLGGICAFVDMEHALDPEYAARCGVDVENLYVSQPDTGEQALEIAEALVRSGAVVAFKSDWASIPVWPFYGMQVAVTRTPPSDPAKEPLNKSEVIKLEDAIRGYTINGAIILNRDKEIGSIEAGKWADMIVIDRNLFETPVAEIHKAQVELTVFKGGPVYKGKKKKAIKFSNQPKKNHHT